MCCHIFTYITDFTLILYAVPFLAVYFVAMSWPWPVLRITKGYFRKDFFREILRLSGEIVLFTGLEGRYTHERVALILSTSLRN